MKTISKFLLQPIKQRFSSLFVSEKQWNRWSSSWSFFFILGFGRSGTTSISSLLNKAPNAYVFHEPVLEDFFAHARTHYNPESADRYLQNFRKKEIFTRMRHIPSGVYGEVNSTIRCHAEAIKKSIPNAVLIHLVRDGRDVVRSTFGRRTMTLKNPFSQSIRPSNTDPWKVHWPEMDRFARICWFWQEENRRLRTIIGRTVQFETLLSSYEYFASEILEPCSLQIDKEDWSVKFKIPRNATSKYSMPEWDDWTGQQKKKFKEICGDEMAKCGYDI